MMQEAESSYIVKWKHEGECCVCTMSLVKSKSNGKIKAIMSQELLENDKQDLEETKRKELLCTQKRIQTT